ncbi:MAG TPA: hypothetical protein VIU29_02390 [Candidatus Deferrimicrobiaceae bacterium]
MKGLFLLDVEEERRARHAREAASREAGPSPPEDAAGEGGGAPPDPGKPLEDYLARWHGNWRGSSSVK